MWRANVILNLIHESSPELFSTCFKHQPNYYKIKNVSSNFIFLPLQIHCAFIPHVNVPTTAIEFKWFCNHVFTVSVISSSNSERRILEIFATTATTSNDEQSNDSVDRQAKRPDFTSSESGIACNKSTVEPNGDANTSNLTSKLPSKSVPRTSWNYWRLSVGQPKTVAVGWRQWLCIGGIHLGSIRTPTGAGKCNLKSFRT